MGVSGNQWGGHIFWDADTWMFPVLALLHPELARPLVDYRFDTLSGAKWNAKQNGYKGADFATESAVTGREMAPAEYPFHDHFGADVAIAQWRYYLLTGDRKRLAEKAYPILRETATYWQSRAVYNKAKDRYEIRHVISPDETAKFVDNDVYTNGAAKFNLLYAVEASKVLGKSYPPEWKTIADKLWLPFDAAHKRYLEHEGYVQTRRKLKQADTELLFFPLGLSAPEDVKANTLSYYAEHASPQGPAMTSSVHTVVAANLAFSKKTPAPGKKDWMDQATDYFRQSYQPFLRAPFNDFSEKRSTNNDTFLTGCAGVGLGPLYGFGGIRYDEQGISARPVLPKGWKRLKITGIHYRGNVYHLEVTPETSGKKVALAKG
jgi:trehalose/maltose hydrolase-like predicted phosphorylase